MKILKLMLKFVFEIIRLPLLLVGFVIGLILKSLVLLNDEAEKSKSLINIFFANLISSIFYPIGQLVMYIIEGNEKLIIKLSAE